MDRGDSRHGGTRSGSQGPGRLESFRRIQTHSSRECARSTSCRAGSNVFHTFVRFGCVESYLNVPFVALLGPTRLAVTFAPLLEGILAVLCFWVLALRVLPGKEALLATLFFAAPAVRFLDVTRVPTGYATVLVTGIATLSLAAAWAERPSALTAGALGLAAGLGLWTSIQTLSATAAAGIWLLLGARHFPLRRLLAPAGTGFLAGALPWFAYSATHALEPLRNNYGAAPTRDHAAAVSNLKYALSDGFSELVVGAARGGTTRPIAALVVAFSALAIAWLIATGLRGAYARAWALPALAALFSVVFFALSSAGDRHEKTARLFILCYPLVAVAAGVLTARIWRKSSVGGALAAVGLVTFNLSGYEMPWSQTRAMRLEAAAEDVQLLAFLENRRIGAIVGDYWSVYSFNYLSGGRVRAISADPTVDYHDYGSRLPASGVRWALVGDEPGVVERWSARAMKVGERAQVGRYTVFLPEPNPPDGTSKEFQQHLQLSFLLPDRIVKAETKDLPLALWR